MKWSEPCGYLCEKNFQEEEEFNGKGKHIQSFYIVQLCSR